jgi:hypothetical protein
MSSTRVGQGRVYVQLGAIDRLDFTDWCDALARGGSYVSDGFAHALNFTVDGRAPGGEDAALDTAGIVTVKATVAFAPATPNTVAQGLVIPATGRRKLGDTDEWNQEPTEEYRVGGDRLVELIVNGRPVAAKLVPADGAQHELNFDVPIEKSSWVALRQFPQLHTNPVNVIVAGKPIRASADSARWCAEIIRLLWNNRERNIAASERAGAKDAYDRAIEIYAQIARESE